MSKFLFAIMATLALLFSGVGVASAETPQCLQARQAAVNLKTLSDQYPSNDGLKLLVGNAQRAVAQYCK
ncbi:MAG: hypothetical protein LC749_02875 [Actinobacteria bacterium]|nr:hypothetical protein [Actinomycetota bacterium]